ncbi:MAG: hypothetical protein POELPBGB_01375 [Bacteroidia bacterium]|nr:hypothetical protein [Bacteroidia bacterium]
MIKRLKFFDEISLGNEVVSELRSLQSFNDNYKIIQSYNAPHIRDAAISIKKTFSNSDNGVLIKIQPQLSNLELRSLVWLLSCNIGKPIVQDESGTQIMYVYDRNRSNSIFNGARYHQTHQGGALHTDQGGVKHTKNVNDPEPIDFLVLGCIQQGLIGGETILVHADELYRELLKFPIVIDILKGQFFWELRGQSQNYYDGPILTIGNDGKPRFRYIRPYMESAYTRLGKKIKPLETWALDVLDSLLESSIIQNRILLNRGEILIFRNDRFVHGRTSFTDDWSDNPAVENNIDLLTNKRLFQRIWLSEK